MPNSRMNPKVDQFIGKAKKWRNEYEELSGEEHIFYIFQLPSNQKRGRQGLNRKGLND